MLTALSIRDVVLIEALELEFAGGLGVLTGETGAGKSILLDALGLALGGRGDSGLVRHGAAQASVTATFEAPAGVRGTARRERDRDRSGRAADRAADRQGRRRQPRASSTTSRRRRRCCANWAGCWSRSTVSTTTAGCSTRADTGPCSTRSGGSIPRPAAKAFADWREAEGALAQARAEIETAARDREWLEHAVGELDALAPEPGEEETLADRRRTMQRAEKVADDLHAVEGFLEGSDGGLSQLRQAARVLERIADAAPALGEALAAIDRAIIEADVAEDRLREARSALHFDPAAQEEDEARLFDLRGLARKHRVQPDDLAALADELRGKLERLQSGEEGIAALEARVAVAKAAYEDAAAALSQARAAAAARLDAAVAGELAPLKLDAARFRTAIVEQPADAWTAAGRDRVEFEVSTNPGAPFGALTRIASGGELSRFILALKVALAEEGSGRDDDLRRDRPRRRRRGGQRDRRAARAAGRAHAIAGGDPQPTGRGAGQRASADRQEQRRDRHPHRCSRTGRRRAP